MYRLEKTEKLMVMSQCLSVPFEDRGDGEMEEKRLRRRQERPKRSVSEREERV